MPQVIVAAFYYGVTAWQFWAVVAVTTYTSYQQSSARRRARNAYNDSLKDRLISVPVVDAARARVYGRVRCADGIVYKATHGTNKENFTLVLALAGHEIDAVEQIYFNDEPITVDGAGYVTTAPWLKTSVTSSRQVIAAGDTTATLPAGTIAGSVGVSTEGSNGDRVAQEAISFTLAGNTITPNNTWTSVVRNVTFQIGSSASKARVRAFSGAPGQDLSTVLAGLPGITAAHRFSGIACLVIDLVYDQDAYPMGPPNVSAVVRGARIFDPRTSTTAWTENPALIARDWALYANGGAAALAELDATSFTAAANVCDLAQSFTTINAAGASTTQTLPLYTAGLVARTDQSPDDVLSEICSAMAGRWAWAGGRLRVRAGAYTAPVATLTEDWVSSAGEIDVVSTVPRTELVNVMVPSIANAAQAYVVAPIPRIAPAEYIAADGGEYPRDVTLTAVTDTAHAAHVCGVMLRDSRQALTISLTCNLRALALEIFDVVAVTLPRFGWAAKPFEVLSWGFSQEGGIKLTLKETDASIFNPDASFSRSDAAPNTALPNPYLVPGVSPSSITSGNAQLLRQADGTILSRIRVAWGPVQDEAVRNGGTIEVRYGPADSDPSTYQTETVAGAETQALLTGVQDGRVYAIATRARNKLVAGQWSIQVLHVVQGKSAPPSNVTSLAATGAPGALRITWAPCPDADYALTELRVGTSWATATRIWRGTGSGFDWASAPGAYTILARHEDTTGNLSSAVVSVSGTALNTVQVGGRNILPGASSGAGWLATSASAGEFAITASATGETNYIYSPYITLPGGVEVTLSFESRQDGAVIGLPDWFLLPDNHPVVGLSAANYPASTDWIKNTFTFTTPAGWGAGASVRLRIDHNGSPGGVTRTYRARRIKLELGNLATDWTPPVEDVDASVSGAQAAAIAAAAADATAKAAAAQTAAQAFAAAQANAADVSARAYADGIVDAEEARAIADATAKANAARAAAEAAAAADATAKANVAATTAQWTGVSSRPSNLAGLTGTEAIRNDELALGQNLIPGSDQAAEDVFGLSYNPNGAVWDAGQTGRTRVLGAALGWTTSNYVMAGTATDVWVIRQIGRRGVAPIDSTVINGEFMMGDLALLSSRSPATELRVPITVGRRYCASMYLSLHRCSARVYLGFYDASGAPIFFTTADFAVDGSNTNALTAMNRRAVISTAPAGAVTAGFFVRKGDTNAATPTDSYVFIAAPQLEEIGANAAGPSPYGPGTLLNSRQLGYLGDLAATRNDVYRQATDPGAVPDGSIWLNTTTGRAQQRVAGAWQPYVGPGSVATGEIAADSVTVVSTSFLAGPVSEANDL